MDFEMPQGCLYDYRDCSVHAQMRMFFKLYILLGYYRILSIIPYI